MKKIALIKFGGHALVENNSLNTLLANIKFLKNNNYNIVIVHGGTPSIQKKLDKEKISSQFIEGYRVTTEEIMTAIRETVLGDEVVSILNHLNKNEINSIGLSGIDNNLITCEKKLFNNGVDYGYVGNVTHINTGLLNILLNNNIIPVISPIGADDLGNTYNLNSDFLASNIAKALNIDVMFMITNVNGVYMDLNDTTSRIPILDNSTAENLISQNIILPVMATKVNACLDFVNYTNNPCYIIDSTQTITYNLFNTSDFGTKIAKTKTEYNIRLAQIEDIPQIMNLTKRSFIKYQENIEYPAGPLNETYEDILRDLYNKYIFVLTKSSNIIGTLRLDINRNIGRISRLCINEHYQNQGIGSYLLKYVENFAYNKGINLIALTTISKVDYLQNFYKKNGYILKDSNDLRGYPRALMVKDIGNNYSNINSYAFI